MKRFNLPHLFVVVVALALIMAACAPPPIETVAPPEIELQATPEVPAPLPGGETVGSHEIKLEATLDAPATLSAGENMALKFALTNNSDTDLYVLKWYTPLEGIAGEIFRVTRDDKPVPYEGLLVMRGDPTPENYVLLKAGASVSNEVDLTPAYDFSQPGDYTITFLSPRISDVALTEADFARTVDDLGPVSMPSHEVTVEIGGSS